jgi:acyl carrier protein
MSETAIPSAEAVRRVILRCLPGQLSPDTLVDGLPLADIAGLDSIDVVEVILACEHAFDVTVCDALLAQGNVSVTSLIEAIARASGGERPT